MVSMLVMFLAGPSSKGKLTAQIVQVRNVWASELRARIHRDQSRLAIRKKLAASACGRGSRQETRREVAGAAFGFSFFGFLISFF